MAEFMGRRREDVIESDLPDAIQVGDYWKIINADGSSVISENPENLTHTCWNVVVPLGEGYGIGNLYNHTVREHEDGTISVIPSDGSSNSILVSKWNGLSWHGFIDHGRFYE